MRAEPVPAPNGVLAELAARPGLGWWGLLAAVSAAVRLLLVDQAPLSPIEASSALVSWDAAQGISGDRGGSTPLLVNLIAAIFWLFGASDVSARLVSALAGAAFVLSPSLLVGAIGQRSALLAGLLIATSPIAVQLSRTLDPAVVTAGLAMLIVSSAMRLLTDRPRWASWALAGGVGLGFAHDGGLVIALAAAAVAALATWSAPRKQLADLARAIASPAARGPTVLAAGLALVAATGGLMDLSGIGFISGGLWASAAQVLTPAPFPTRNLATLAFYGGPLLALAAGGAVAGIRAGDRMALFLGRWLLLLVVLAAGFGEGHATLAILPVAPAALLSTRALRGVSVDPARLRLGAAGWGAAALTLAVGGGLLIGVAYWTAAGSRPQSTVLLVAAGLALGATVYLWVWSVAGEERLGAALVVGAVAFTLFSVGSIGRLSFGGSPRGSEPLPIEQTHPAFREVFDELRVLALADSSRFLPVDEATPAEVRWYGRAIRQRPVDREGSPFLLRPVPAGSSERSPAGQRIPWKTVSKIDGADLHPLGVARWAVSRAGLVEGETHDIIVFR